MIMGITNVVDPKSWSVGTAEKPLIQKDGMAKRREKPKSQGGTVEWRNGGTAEKP